ncbi:MAG: hypothetical protein VCB63_16025 [Alphaproteobacteria bacterium]
MKKLSLMPVAIVLLLIGGGVAFLAMWEIPAPSTPMTKVLADDRFPR